MGSLGVPEPLIILAIALIIFGPKKRPALERSLGEAIRGVKDSVNENGRPDGGSGAVPGDRKT